MSPKRCAKHLDNRSKAEKYQNGITKGDNTAASNLRERLIRDSSPTSSTILPPKMRSTVLSVKRIFLPVAAGRDRPCCGASERGLPANRLPVLAMIRAGTIDAVDWAVIGCALPQRRS